MPAPQLAVAPMPRQWHEKEMWKIAFEQSTEVLSEFNKLLSPIIQTIIDTPPHSAKIPAWSSWLADASAWLLSFIEACARDAWVLGVSNGGRSKPMAPNTNLDLDVSDAPDLDELETVLTSARASGSINPDTFNACIKWMRPQAPRPPRCLIQNNEVLTQHQSHDAWIQQLRQQGALANAYFCKCKNTPRSCYAPSTRNNQQLQITHWPQ